MGKKKAITQYVDKILADIEDTENRMAALRFALNGLRDPNGYSHGMATPSVEEQFSQIYSAFYRKLSDQFKYLLMYGVIDDDARKRAKKIAYEKYFAQKVGVKDGDPAVSFQRSGWFDNKQLEDEFLADIKSQMFAERNKLDLDKDIIDRLENEVVDKTISALTGEEK